MPNSTRRQRATVSLHDAVIGAIGLGFAGFCIGLAVMGWTP